MKTDYCSGLRVLVVDDAPFMVRVVTRMLRQLGVNNVHEANDGTTGIEMLRYHRSIDLVLCDLEMPEMDGLEFIKTVRSGTNGTIMASSGVPNPYVPIIIFSKHAWEEPVKESVSLGADGFLIKPTTPKALSEQISTVMKAQGKE